MYCFYNIVNITDFSDSDYEYCLSLMTEERKSRVERLRFADGAAFRGKASFFFARKRENPLQRICLYISASAIAESMCCVQ